MAEDKGFIGGDLEAWVGREQTTHAVVSADLVTRFRATFGDEPAPPRAGDVVPRLLHFCLDGNTVATDALAVDGHPHKGDFLPPVPLPRRMWAGSRIAFHGDLRIGDEVRHRSRIHAVKATSGKSGPLVFVTVAHIHDVDGRVAIEEMQDIVYRGSAGAPPPASVAPTGRHVEPFAPSPVLLFRYAAITFNAHRIHYDRPYATTEEHYDGLVVQGPLQATLLFRHATRVGGREPSHFSFRGLRPLFDHDRATIHASESSTGVDLWIARSGGPTTMSAEAAWR